MKVREGRLLDLLATILAILFIFSSCASLNKAPTLSNPSPEDGATNVPINIVLSWNASDPDGDPVKFDVYFGKSSNPPLVATDLTDSSYDPGILEYSTTYHWRVVAKDDHGNITQGPVWSFTTIESSPSNIPENPDPSNGAQDVFELPTLSWEGPDATYTVYLSRVREYVESESSLALIGITTSKEIELSFYLDYETTYYWKVVAQTEDGSKVESEIWSFKTRENPNSDKIFMRRSYFGSYYYNYLTVFETNGEPIGTTFLGKEYLQTFKVLSDKMYVLYTEDSKTKVVIYDVSDPMNPSVLKENTFDVHLVPKEIFITKGGVLVLDTHSFNSIYFLDIENGVYEKVIDNVHYAFLEDNLLFTDGPSLHLRIFDVSDPSSPKLLKDVNAYFDHEIYPYNFVVTGKYLLGIGSDGVNVYDLDTLEKIYTFEMDLGSDQDFILNSDRLAIKSSNRIVVLDVSDPSSPSIVRSIETNAQGFYVQDDVLIYSDYNGLTILDMDSSSVLYSGDRLFGVFGDRLKVVDGKLFSSGYVMNVVDVSNPHLPKVITTRDLGYTSYRFGISEDIEFYENRIFTSLELPGGYKGLVVFDFDGSSLTLVSTPLSGWPMNVELVGGSVYASAHYPGKIYSIDPETLELSLFKEFPSSVRSMTGYGNKLYVSLEDGTLVVLDLKNVDSAWRIEIGTVLQTTLKSDGDYLYGKSAKSDDNDFYIIDLSNGDIVYEGNLGVMMDFVVDGDRLYALTPDSHHLKIYDITNRSSPTEISGFELSSSNYYGIYKSGELLYIIGSSGLWILNVSSDDPKPAFHDTKLIFDEMDN